MANETVLVVVAHPDDEVLGCGGTICRHVAEGDNVHLMVLSNGVDSRIGVNNLDLELRRIATQKAQDILKIDSLETFDFPDNQMDAVPLLEIIKALDPVFLKIRPSIVYTHHYGDLNIDHRITQQAVMTACRPKPEFFVKQIYGFEVLSSTEWATPQAHPFLPTLFVDISDHLYVKLNALKAYDLEMESAPHSRSVEHAELLARHRGQSVGVFAAEAFVPYRMIR
jgi:LmbE family N-acetylglucosaminyl deacetylase